jgi:hypothetical protein
MSRAGGRLAKFVHSIDPLFDFAWWKNRKPTETITHFVDSGEVDSENHVTGCP